MKFLAIYEAPDGSKPYSQWLSSLKDRVVIARINARLGRVEAGNFGDTKPVGQGVMELRFAFGSGYRVYYGIDRDLIVIILIGGDKSSQRTDIERAQGYWKDYLWRTRYGENE